MLDDNYLVVVDRHSRGLYQVSLDSDAQHLGGRVVPLPVNLSRDSFAPYAAAFDAVHRIVYWTDLNEARIMRTPLNGRQGPSEPLIGRLSSVATHVFTVPRTGQFTIVTLVIFCRRKSFLYTVHRDYIGSVRRWSDDYMRLFSCVDSRCTSELIWTTENYARFSVKQINVNWRND